MLRSVDMQDYMLHNPPTVKADDNLFDAIHIILASRISGVSVVDDSHKLVGMLSEMDCLKGILSAVYNKSPAGNVEEFMSINVTTVSLHDNIVDVASNMLERKQRRRPVLDQDGTLIGQVSCRQLLRAAKEFALPEDPTEY
jgi:CBS domain-containing protein